MASNIKKNAVFNGSKEMDKMLVSYGDVFFIEGVDSVHVFDEEREFYQIMTKAFSNQSDNSTEMIAFQNYIIKLILSIRNHFKSRIINRFSESIQQNINEEMNEVWNQMIETLSNLEKRAENMQFYELAMVGVSLLFLIRTSNRCLFLYLNQIKGSYPKNNMYKALVDVVRYTYTFLLKFVNVDIKSKLLQTFAICKKIYDKLSDIMTFFKDYNINNNSDKIEYTSIKYRLAKSIPYVNDVALVFDAMNIPLTKTGLEDNNKQHFSKLYSLCLFMLQLETQSNEYIRELGQEQYFRGLYSNGSTFLKLVLAFEEISGAVRVIPKVRKIKNANATFNSEAIVPSNNAQHAGSMKAQHLISVSKYLRSFLSRRKHYMRGGNVNYDVVVDKKGRQIIFKGIPSTTYDAYFSKYKIYPPPISTGNFKEVSFGPFYSVHETADLVDEVINDSLNIDLLVKQFEQSNEQQNLVLYTYGYSGSGKTYTLFAEVKKEKLEKMTESQRLENRNNALVWRIVEALISKGFKVNLEETRKCYGTLEMSGAKCTFQDLDIPKTGKNKIARQNIDAWIDQINTDLVATVDSHGMVKADSFVKPTLNNPDSSRGFYILKFSITKGKVTHNLGLVDMAGNEDPSDLQSVMLPTFPISKIDMLIKSIEKQDIVNHTSKILSQDVVYSRIMDIMYAIFKAILDAFLKNIMTGNTFEFKNALKNIISTEIDYLKDFKITPQRTQSNVLGNGKCSRLNTSTTQKKFTIYKLSDENKCTVMWNTDAFKFEFIVKNEFLVDILKAEVDSRINIYKTKQKEDKDATEFEQVLSIEQIRDRLISIKNAPLENVKNEIDVLETHVLKYVTENPKTIQLEQQTFCFDFDKDIDLKTIDTNNPEIKTIRAAYSKTTLIQKKLRMQIEYFFASQPYIFVPPKDDSIKVSVGLPNSVQSLIAIIKEGYYINQANAELIDYFTQKKEGNVEQALQSANKGQYSFDDYFKLSTYDKFKRIKSNNGKYETNLVPSLIEMFTSNSKDIMFACLWGVGLHRVKGAIDTLYLVKDIKST